MTDQHPEEPRYDSEALDELIDSAMGGILARLEAKYDHDAGLADVYARAAALRQSAGQGNPAETGTALQQPAKNASARLQEICGHIDMIDSWLAAIVRAAQATPFGGAAFLDLARPTLMQLRLGLANRTLGKADAERLTSAFQHHLGEADRIVRSQHGAALDEIVREYATPPARSGGALSADIRTLEEMIKRLFADVGHDLTLVPVL
jgi:hypothetical protein